ncbi:13635_t:CDS:2, partial [Acaulospora colombiana]
MHRSDSVSSTGSRSSGTFGYHQRLLEGSSGPASLSRATSLNQRPPSILSPPAGSTSARKWIPTHRTGQSVDMVQSRAALWEERARANLAENPSTPSSSDSPPTSHHIHRRSVDLSRPHPETGLPPTPPSKVDTPSKRHTLSTPLDYTTYNPTTSSSSAVTSTSPPLESNVPSTPRSTLPGSVQSAQAPQPDSHQGPSHKSWRSSESVAPSLTGSSTGSSNASTETAQPQTPATPASEYKSSFMLQRRSAKKYNESLTSGRRLGRHMPRIASGDGNASEPEEDKPKSKPLPEPPMEDKGPIKRFDEFDDKMRTSARQAAADKLNGISGNERRIRAPSAPTQWDSQKLPTSPRSPVATHSPSSSQEHNMPTLTSGEDVAGVPGRVRLSRSGATFSAPTTPLKTRPASGLWADVQRHMIQTYEYLCHIGEAQQWIEGCLGEELSFGVVEMDEGLRNGVVLARLAQDPRLKLGWRHTDNINHFLVFVRKVGLPECFIFIVTDLYDKKNFPKVVYCIHALAHLLSRRGMAQRIGNLVGRLKFTDDQLQQTQKGLKAAGVPMPNFGDIGRDLAKEINEEEEQEVETEDEQVEDSIIMLQALCRQYLASQQLATQKA